MAAKSSVLLIRHGHRRDFEVENYVTVCEDGFPYDPPLSDLGTAQAQQLGEHVAGLADVPPVKLVVCSPYIRCVKTAAAVADRVDVPMRLFSGCGEWLTRSAAKHGQSNPLHRSFDQLHELFPRLERSAQPDHPVLGERCLDRTEPKDELIVRATAAFDELARLSAELGGGTVVCVSHAATLLALQHRHHDGDLSDVRTGLCSVSHYRGGPPWVRTIAHDTSFLQSGEMHHWSFAQTLY